MKRKKMLRKPNKRIWITKFIFYFRFSFNFVLHSREQLNRWDANESFNIIRHFAFIVLCSQAEIHKYTILKYTVFIVKITFENQTLFYFSTIKRKKKERNYELKPPILCSLDIILCSNKNVYHKSSFVEW